MNIKEINSYINLVSNKAHMQPLSQQFIDVLRKERQVHQQKFNKLVFMNYSSFLNNQLNTSS